MDKLGDRNNTSFSKELSDLLKKLEHSKDDPLQYHQRITHDYLLQYPHVRGVLGYQEMGSGKSILAVSLCESVALKFPHMKILIIASKSLHNNMKDNIKKYLKIKAEKENTTAPSEEETENHINNMYRFISLNAGNMLKQVYRANKPDSLDELNNLSRMDKAEWIEQIVEKELQKIKELGNLDDTFVVVDEAHNFFNSIVHGSKNAIGLYNLIMNAKRIKLLFLTGSPIVNDPFEIAVCYNMLAGKMINRIDKVYHEDTLFGEDYDDFIRYFVQDPTSLDLDKAKSGPPIMKNMDKFANRITGLTSYYSTARGDVRKLFPKLLDLEIVKVHMSGKQYGLYAAARDREMYESKRGVFKSKKKPLQKPGGSTSSYRVRSRQISNFLYPPYASDLHQDQKGGLVYQKNINKLTEDTFKLNTDDGLDIWSPKMLQILIRISRHTKVGVLDAFKKLDPEPEKSGKEIGPVLIYSQFLDSGILVLGKIMEYYNVKEVKNSEDLLSLMNDKSKHHGTYCVISGEVDTDVRTELLKAFTAIANKYGDLIPILLFTSTGAEGMDTKYVRAVMAIESYWHWARMEQVYARGVRLGSHMDLPEKDRTVRPYLFLSDYPLESTIISDFSADISEGNKQIDHKKNLERRKKQEDTTDITLYSKAQQNRHLINQFLRNIQESSIDCSLWNSLYGDDKLEQLRCRVCKPTDRLLFIPNLDKDIMSISNCTLESLKKEEKIKAKTLIMKTQGEKKEYKYSIDPENGEIHIYEYNEDLNGYEEISAEHINYLDIYNAVAKKEKTPQL
jgi:hypothetical protein